MTNILIYEFCVDHEKWCILVYLKLYKDFAKNIVKKAMKAVIKVIIDEN